jgi:hypothetical protein
VKADLISGAFLSYMDDVIPKGAPTVQIQECKRAFYAGAKAILDAMSVISEEDVPEGQGVVVLELLHREAKQFGQDVLAGKE